MTLSLAHFLFEKTYFGRKRIFRMTSNRQTADKIQEIDVKTDPETMGRGKL